MCVSQFLSAYHGLISVLLELDQTNPGDILQVHVSVGAVWGVSVQVWRSGRGSHPQRLVTVDLMGHHIVGLQQSLRGIHRQSEIQQLSTGGAMGNVGTHGTARLSAGTSRTERLIIKQAFPTKRFRACSNQHDITPCLSPFPW